MQYFTVFCICLLMYLHNSLAIDHEQFRQEVLTQHNIYRKEQCASPLQRNTTLDEVAQSWCDKLVQTGDFAHSNTTEHGETSFQKIPCDLKKEKGTTPVLAWYSEKSNYTVTNPGRALHFSQLVWKNTKMIGVGVCSTPKNNGCIVVANYYPRGNYENQFAQNVGC